MGAEPIMGAVPIVLPCGRFANYKRESQGPSRTANVETLGLKDYLDPKV